jgi:hypothetical protein
MKFSSCARQDGGTPDATAAPRRRRRRAALPLTLPVATGNRSQPVVAEAGRGVAAPLGGGSPLPSGDTDEIADLPQQVVERERKAEEAIPSPYRLVCCRLLEEAARRGEDNDGNTTSRGLLPQAGQ